MMASNEDSCISNLPDGRRLELCSQEGADAFLKYNPSGSFNFFTQNFGVCKTIRRKNTRRLNAGEKDRLTMVAFMADSLAQYSTRKVFAECVPDDEISFWLDYVMEELKKLISDEAWLATGELHQHDAFTINPCVSMFKHDSPSKLAYERQVRW